MRRSAILVALVVSLLSIPAAAQTRMMPSARLLPAALVPSPVEPGTRHAALSPVEVGGLTGMAVGLVVGGIYGSLTYEDRCGQPEDGCTLGRGMDTGVFAIIGGSLGGVIGAGTGALLGLRGGRGDASAHADRAPLTLAPLTVARLSVVPGTDGAMRVEVRLRH